MRKVWAETLLQVERQGNGGNHDNADARSGVFFVQREKRREECAESLAGARRQTDSEGITGKGAENGTKGVSLGF